MLLQNLDKYKEIVIQMHDNPDADAVGSAYALYNYFLSKGKKTRIVYGGRFQITKSNMRMLISELDIPVEYVEDLDNPELLLTVDCQYGEGNVQCFEAQNIAMIDHHNTGKQSDDMAEIRSRLASCATVCYALLKEAGYDVNQDTKVATALYYGLYMDSNQLSEIRHPLDRDMVDFLQYDPVLISRLKYANFSISDLETAAIAIIRHSYLENHRTAIVSSKPCDPNILGLIGDLVLQVDNVDVCIIFNECPGGFKFSVRSCIPEVAANELAGYLTTEIGDGGGHIDKAGGFISELKFLEEYDGQNIENYIYRKMDEYFDGYDVVHYNKEAVDTTQLKRYRKRSRKFGYVKSTDVFPAGTECKIRTLEGDAYVVSDETIYLMIGSSGEVYPMEKSVFESKYEVLDGNFEEILEYEPLVIRVKDNKRYALMPFAKVCRSLPSAAILAKPLRKLTKVFTKWEYETYMAGKEGDMLCYVENDLQDVYIVKKEIFSNIYEEFNN